MIALPIATRELLVLARNPLTYRGRWISAAAIFVVSGGFAVLFSSMGRITGAELLASFSRFIMIYCVAAGVQSTADSLSKEKREGTIGLLFLTLLKSADIVIGKLIAGTLATFFSLMAGFPMLCLALLQGGVEWKDLLRFFLATINTLFVAASIGLFSSSIATNRKFALSTSTWLSLLFLLGVPGLQFAAALAPEWNWAVRPLSALNLWNTFKGTSRMPSYLMVEAYWIPLAVTHLVGWGFLALAVFNLPRKWQDKPAQGKGMPLKERFRQWTFGKPVVRLAWRRKLLDKNAFFWLAARDRLKPAGPWTLLIILTAVFTWLSYMADSIEGMILPYLMINSIALKFYLCGAASQKLLEEKESGTLELLLSTPLSVRQIMLGQIRALWVFARGPYLIQLGLQLAAFVYYIFNPFVGPEPWLFLLACAGFIFFFVIDFPVIALAGMWTAMIVKKPNQAAGATIVRALFPPGLIILFCSLALLFLNLMAGISMEIPDWFFVPFYYVLSLGNALFWLFYVTSRLPVRMRQLAFERFTPEARRPWWKTLLRINSGSPPVLARS